MRGPIAFIVALALATGAGALLAAPGSAPLDAAATDEGELPGFPFVAPSPRTADGQRAPRVSEVSRDESLLLAVGVCPTAPGACVNVIGQSTRSMELGQAFGAGELDLEITWSASTPSTQRLQASLKLCSDRCSATQAAHTTVISGSPLSMRATFDESDGVERDTLLVLEVSDAETVPGPSEAHVRPTSQPFRVGGVIVYP